MKVYARFALQIGNLARYAQRGTRVHATRVRLGETERQRFDRPANYEDFGESVYLYS
jgi:hypothetical protein